MRTTLQGFALWDSLQNLTEAAKKYVLFPDRILPIDYILKSLDANIKKTEIPTEVIKYVDKLI